MKNFIIRIYFFLKVFGLDPLKSGRAIISLPRYFRDLIRLNYQKESASKKFSFGMPYPCLGEHKKTSGTASGHYFHQDLIVCIEPTKEELMADCPICKKEDAQGLHTRVITTAIQTQTRIKTGFKQYQVTTRTFAPEEHIFNICDSCEFRYNRIIPYTIWAIAIILAVLAYIFVEHEDPTLVLFCVSPMPLALAFFLTTSFLSLNAKLKNQAIKDRKATSTVQTIVGFTAKEYERFVKQANNKRF